MSIARVRGPGQSDQACDLIAAAIVEEYLRRDPAAQLNLHVAGGQGAVFVVGEVLSAADFDVAAVVRRALGTCGVSAAIEPFIALEPIAAPWAPQIGTRDTLTLTGYATSETADHFPRAASLAHDLARELERRRTSDPEWFWLGSDYVVTVEDRPSQPLVVIRAEHVESQDVAGVREQLRATLASRVPAAEFRINASGEETRAGLGSRIGASGKATALDQFGSLLPSNASGVGLHLRHPLNLGAWLLRAVAKELVEAKKGKAVMAQATWLPLESRPHLVRIRNERGEDISSLIDLNRLDLSKAPDTFLMPNLVSAAARHAFDGSASVPWEGSMLK
jgi:S-adenosylmethionine synthetase